MLCESKMLKLSQNKCVINQMHFFNRLTAQNYIKLTQ